MFLTKKFSAVDNLLKNILFLVISNFLR